MVIMKSYSALFLSLIQFTLARLSIPDESFLTSTVVGAVRVGTFRVHVIIMV